MDLHALTVSLGAVLAALLIVSAILGWIGELKRFGAATSAQESRQAAYRRSSGARRGPTASQRARAQAARTSSSEQYERVRAAYFAKERRARDLRRKRAHAAGPTPRRPRASSGGGQSRSRPATPPPPSSPSAVEAQHRATLLLRGPLTASSLRAAYLRQVAAYHPDRVATLGVKLRRLAEEETKNINAAYAYLQKRLD